MAVLLVANGVRVAAANAPVAIRKQPSAVIADKAAAEDMLRDAILAHLDKVPEGQQIMLKLSQPEALPTITIPAGLCLSIKIKKTRLRNMYCTVRRRYSQI